MPFAERSTDEFLVTRDRVTLTDAQLRIPGLRMLGHHAIWRALQPLSWQYHENAFEFTLSAKGSFVFNTLEKGYSFGRGDVFVSYPDEIHSTGQEPFASGEIYWFQLDMSCEDSLLFLSREASRELAAALRAMPHHVIHTDTARTLPLVENAFRAALAGEDPQLTAAWLVLFLRILLTYTQKESPRVSPQMQAVLERIEKELTTELPLEELAALAGLSLSQFKQNFKRELGVPPRHFINRRKIEYAAGLLLEGSSVTRTALLLGFSDSSYFSSVFKKYTSRTPTEYVRERSAAAREKGR